MNFITYSKLHFKLVWNIKYSATIFSCSELQVNDSISLIDKKVDCDEYDGNINNVVTYRKNNSLLYPINVARNTARLLAQTLFVLPCDIELYPSINFIPGNFTQFNKLLY